MAGNSWRRVIALAAAPFPLNNTVGKFNPSPAVDARSYGSGVTIFISTRI